MVDHFRGDGVSLARACAGGGLGRRRPAPAEPAPIPLVASEGWRTGDVARKGLVGCERVLRRLAGAKSKEALWG